ncbi:hypothetical protein ACIOD1_12845 [Streptomyces sp. NPDC088097]|uniref:hypothetical protein n=1 Tax=Streptomyces sp. NPDC088097 TaxID=3365823 RepID=UPI00380E798A
MTEQPEILPALHFTTAGPDGQPITYRVDMGAPISLRDRELLRALMSTAHKLLTASEHAARFAEEGQP